MESNIMKKGKKYPRGLIGTYSESVHCAQGKSKKLFMIHRGLFFCVFVCVYNVHTHKHTEKKYTVHVCVLVCMPLFIVLCPLLLSD